MSVRPMVWKRPNWPDQAWIGDCLIAGCSYTAEGDTLVVTADELRWHVRTCHPTSAQVDRLRAAIERTLP
jgi:hypothetical protein